MAKGDKLTEKQQRFVEAFCGKAKGNATKAARMAGYESNDETLSSIGSENLRKPQILEAIGRMAAKVRSSAVADVREVQERLTLSMRGDPSLYEGQLEFTVDGSPVVDPLKLRPNEEHVNGIYADGGDIFYRRPPPVAVGDAAAIAMGKIQGQFVVDINLKREMHLEKLLASIMPKLSPEAHAEVLAAMESVRPDEDEESEDE